MTNDFSTTLAACLAAIEQRGSSIEECVAQYPDQRAALLELLPLAATLRAAPIVAPSREFQVVARRRLLARLPKYQTSSWKSFNLWIVMRQWFTLRQRILMRIAIAITALILFGTSVIAVSAQALPNDWLYPVKLAVEQARLALAFTAQQRSELHLRFVEERLAEVQRLIDLGRGADATPAIDNLANQLEAATQNLSDVPDHVALLAQLNDVLDRSENFLDRSADRLPASTQAAIQHTRGVLRAIPRSEPNRSEPQSPLSVPPGSPSVTPWPTPTQIPPTHRPIQHVVTPPPARPTIVRTWPMTSTPHLPTWPWPTLQATPPLTRPTFAPPSHIRPTGVFTWPMSTPPTFSSPTFSSPTFRPPTITPWPWPTLQATPTFAPPPHIQPTGVFTWPMSAPPTFSPPTFRPPTITPPTVRPPTFVPRTPTHPVTSFGHWPFPHPIIRTPSARFPH